jgi:hypothetical protein
VPTFVDRGVLRGQRGGSPTVVNLSFLDRIRNTYTYKYSTNYYVLCLYYVMIYVPARSL